MTLNPSMEIQIPILWPVDVGILKITTEEQKLINNNIIKAIAKIPQKNFDNDPYIICFRNNSCPRRLFITNDHWFVVLNHHNGLDEFPCYGAQQKKVTYVWDCNKGSLWLKKRVFSEKQIEFIQYLQYSETCGKSNLGFPEMIIDKKTLYKYRYFEKKANNSLPVLLKNSKCSIQIEHLLGLIDAVKKIHSTNYKPAKFSYNNTEITFANSYTLFHGDISPNNIIYEMVEFHDELSPRIMLTDFYGFGDCTRVVWTRGWASPECIQFSVTRSKYQEFNDQEFLMKYGAKKDSWALGLIIGSLIRGSFHINYPQPLPCFSFITNKLIFNKYNFVMDESGIENLTQEEIDSKIDSLIELEKSDLIKILWKFVKNLLIINPDERPSLEEFDFKITFTDKSTSN